MSDSTGKVYLVGAGPGSVDYLTVRGKYLIGRADVLVYDALADDALLQWAPSNCLQLNVGKRGGQPSTPQAEIDRLLVKYGRQGKQVVRLKSGDPFIFGRCTGEIQALIAANCPFEVVPGISSVLAAPLLAGIPLTDPVLSRCFATLSGHDPAALDWEALARIDTLVVLMGGTHLATILGQLQRYGRSPQTPIAIVRWAGRPQQQIWTGTLGDILARTQGESLSPCAIVIGEVVGLRECLQSPYPIELPSMGLGERGDRSSFDRGDTDHKPLMGQTILITRSVGQSSEFSDRLISAGATAMSMPTLEIVPPSSWQDLDRSIDRLDEFDWLVLTSANGVEAFFDRLFVGGKDARHLAHLKIAVVGKKTARSLQQHGLQPDLIPPNFVADSLVESFPSSVAGQRILFPRVESGGREVLVRQLNDRYARVVEVAAYESRCPKLIPPEPLAALQQNNIDIITFASSKTVKYFCQLIKGAARISLEGVRIASIGPQTSQTCRELLGRVDVEATEYTMEGLYRSLLKLR
ncbi:uroporphyrinogen-III C-methyltransferase [Oscillatoriales cyanobacterium LEGE 11467]|uniref:uroporphyrinogen-III C-methyltransferase n=1 Tax=Zarconia navalis LEGE 11467 TaxID=1828826 RepID=A0A928VV36_9CYAN|nr:uroporphyrinogen-III C-methyltransferase [Zarconia navalis]MBE9039843.1 uroporphyrinogen-III C-methyltransferase [Zarconia navalis LEGE 11467]